MTCWINERVALPLDGLPLTRGEQETCPLADNAPRQRLLRIPTEGVTLDGDLVVPAGARGVVVFAHGSGSSWHSPRNRRVAAGL